LTGSLGIDNSLGQGCGLDKGFRRKKKFFPERLYSIRRTQSSDGLEEHISCKNVFALSLEKGLLSIENFLCPIQGKRDRDGEASLFRQ